MSQSYVDISLHSSDCESDYALSDTSEFKDIEQVRRKPKVAPNNEKTKKNTQSKGPQTPAHKKTPNKTMGGTKSKAAAKTREGPPDKIRSKSSKANTIASLTSKSKVKVVPKTLEADFKKLPNKSWKKVILPKDHHPLPRVKHKRPKKTIDEPFPPKTKKQMVQAVSQATHSKHRIDALLATVSDMCRLVINEK